jgi:hypothetical protein
MIFQHYKCKTKKRASKKTNITARLCTFTFHSADCELCRIRRNGYCFLLGAAKKQVCYERQRISFLLVRQRGWRRNETRRDSVRGVRGVMQPLAAAAWTLQLN